MPYRSNKERRRVEPEQVGMIADMVRQFADPFAFLRELVQNGIDAGASRLEIRFELGDDGVAALSVDDDGEGMDRAIIEGPLLTLFNSAKDRDATKIGRYGVGFVSVLAIEPDEVQVHTSRDDQGWLLRLLPDHSYELAEADVPRHSGTTVTLLKAASAETFDEHVRGGRVALVRWCRHAQLPIHLVVRRPGADASRERMDAELNVPAAVRLRRRLATDGGLEESYVVAPSAGHSPAEGEEPMGDSFAGFYNRGLTLFETNDPPHPRLRGIRFKVDSPRLQHTVSRDNVRHDDGYVAALATVVELVGEPLETVVEAALRKAAQDASAGKASARYLALLHAAVAQPLALSAERVTVPLCDPVIGEERVSAVAGLEADQTLHHASARSELTAALARDHMPVLLADQAAALTLIRSLSSAHFIDVGEHFVHARELPKADVSRSDRRLLAEVRHSLEASGAKVTHVALAACLCDPGRRAALCVEDETREHVMTLEAGARWRRRFGSGLRLLLVQEHAAIIAARAMAEREASTAGQLLARYLLAEQYGELSVRQSDGILEHGLQGLQKATKRSRARGAR